MFPQRFKMGKSQSDVDRVVSFVVRHASSSVPAYRSRLDDLGLSAAPVRTAADLNLLPIVRKESMFGQTVARDLLCSSAVPSRAVITSTSGYSGLPIDVYMSRMEALYRRALLWRAWRRFARLPLRLRVADVGAWVRNGKGYEVARRGTVSVLRVSMRLPLHEQLDLIAQHAPHVVSGYPTVLTLLAEQMDGSTRHASVRLVATRGEILHAEERAAIEHAFQCRLADFYNCEEIGNVATECLVDPGVLHVNTDACIVEVVDGFGTPVPKGEEGRLLMTSLYNCTMPFIRYDVGDRVHLVPEGSNATCVCGSHQPRMRVLEGREDDYISLHDGRRISPRLVGNAVYRAADVLSKGMGHKRCFRQFQVIQDEADELRILVVPAELRGHELQGELCRELRKIQPGLRCTVAFVESIPLEPSGKLKKVVRRVAPRTRGGEDSTPRGG